MKNLVVFQKKSIKKNAYKVKTEKIIAHSALEIDGIAFVIGKIIAKANKTNVMTQSTI